MDDALKLIECVQRKDPDFMKLEVYLLLGDRLASNHMRQYKEAQEFYTKARNLDTECVEVYVKIGFTYEK
jgi:hypothetical protein